MPFNRPDYSLADITGRYIGQPFSACTCVDLVRRVFADVGCEIPDRIGDLTADNYLEVYPEKKQWVQDQLVLLVETLGTSADADRLNQFDLVLMWQQEQQNLFPAVAVSRSMVMASTIEQGVSMLAVNDDCRAVLARRVI